ncbi:hypothetical protein BJX99DRAFT_226487 [Aspergillus californicus]
MPQNKQYRKSRSGCRTCRARHVKCDETPDACNKCKSTGRICDGYDAQRLPLCKSTILHELPTGFSWAVTSDEQRCFSIFKDQFIPAMLGLFESPIYDRVILQLCRMDPAYFHAAVALGADDQESRIHGLALPGEDRHNAWTWFAIEQSSRSFSLLRQRNASNDPALRLTILGCCMLYILQGLLRGEYDTGARHLQGGLKVIRESSMQGARMSPFETSLVGGLRHLDIMFVFFGFGESQSGNVYESIYPPWPVEQISTFHGARHALDILIHNVCLFLNQCWSLACIGEWNDHPRQQRLLEQVDAFSQPITLFYDHPFNRLRQNAMRSSDFIYLWHNAFVEAARVCILQCNAAVIDHYTPEFQGYLSSLDRLREKLPKRPSMIMDLSIIPVIFVLSVGCPDQTMRSLATRALESWPHDQKTFDDLIAAMVGAEYRRTTGGVRDTCWDGNLIGRVIEQKTLAKA